MLLFVLCIITADTIHILSQQSGICKEISILMTNCNIYVIIAVFPPKKLHHFSVSTQHIHTEIIFAVYNYMI